MLLGVSHSKSANYCKDPRKRGDMEGRPVGGALADGLLPLSFQVPRSSRFKLRFNWWQLIPEARAPAVELLF